MPTRETPGFYVKLSRLSFADWTRRVELVQRPPRQLAIQRPARTWISSCRRDDEVSISLATRGITGICLLQIAGPASSASSLPPSRTPRLCGRHRRNIHPAVVPHPCQAGEIVDEPVERSSGHPADVFHGLVVAADGAIGERRKKDLPRDGPRRGAERRLKEIHLHTTPGSEPTAANGSAGSRSGFGSRGDAHSVR